MSPVPSFVVCDMLYGIILSGNLKDAKLKLTKLNAEKYIEKKLIKLYSFYRY